MTKDQMINALNKMFPDGCSRVTPAMKQALIDGGFLDAPASAHHHGNYPGGLFDHSLNVAVALKQMTEAMHFQWQDNESPYIVGMFHDLCKVDHYTADENGNYHYSDTVINGHGEKSIAILSTMITLT